MIMTLFFADLVRVACQGTGAGIWCWARPLPGHRGVRHVCRPARAFIMRSLGVTRPEEWETGEGELGSGGSLVRMPLSSSAERRRSRFLAGAEDGGADRRRGLVRGARGGGGGRSRSTEVDGLTEAARRQGRRWPAPISRPAALSTDASTGFYRVDGGQGGRQAGAAGWSIAGPGTAWRGPAFDDVGTVTISQLAQRVKALIDDLTDHGLIGG